MRANLLTAMLAALLLQAPSADTAAPSTQTIAGRVVNGTLRQPAAGVRVMLLRMRPGEAPIEHTARSDGKGRFRFTVGNATERDAYVVVAEHGGAAYTAGPIRPGPDRRATADLVIYEPTSDPGVVAVPYHLILVLRVRPGRLQVRELLAVASRTPRAFVGAGGVTLRLALPPGAEAVRPVRGLAPAGVSTDAMLDALPVTPVVREAVMEYEVPFRWRRAVVRWRIGYPTQALDVIAPEDVRATPLNLVRRDAREVRGERLRRFAAEDLRPGAEVGLALRELPLDVRPYLVGGAAGLLVLAVGVALAFPFFRRGRGVPSPS